MSPAPPSWADAPKPSHCSAPAPSSTHRSGSAPTRGVMAQVGTASSPLPPPAVAATAPSAAASADLKVAGGPAAAGSSADPAASASAGGASGSAEMRSASDQPKTPQELPGPGSATCSGTGRGSGGCGSTTLEPCAPDDDADGEQAGSAEVLRPSALFDMSARGASSATGATGVAGGGQAGLEWEATGLSHKRALSEGGNFMAAGAAASAAVAAGDLSDMKRLRRFVSATRPPLRADASPQLQATYGASLGSAVDGAPRAMSVDGKSINGGSATGTPGGSTATTGGGDVDVDVAGVTTTATATATAANLSASASTSAVSALRRVDGRHPGLGSSASPIHRAAGAYQETASEGLPRAAGKAPPSADMRNLCNMLGLDATTPSLPSAASVPPAPAEIPPAPFPLPPAGPSAHSQRRSNSPLQPASLRKHLTLPNHSVPSLLAKLRRRHGHGHSSAGGSPGAHSGGSATPPLGSSAASVRQLMKALGLPPVPSPPQPSLLHAAGASPTALHRNAPGATAASLPNATALSSVVGGLQAQLHAKQRRHLHTQQQRADPSALTAAGSGAGAFGFPTSVDGLFDWISQPVGSDSPAFHADAFAACVGGDASMDPAAFSASASAASASASTAAAGEGGRGRAGTDSWRSAVGAGLWIGPSPSESGGALTAGLSGGLCLSSADGRVLVGGGHSASTMRSVSPALAATAASGGGNVTGGTNAAAEAFNLSVVRQSYLESLKDVSGVPGMLGAPGMADIADLLTGTAPPCKPKDAFSYPSPDAANAAPMGLEEVRIGIYSDDRLRCAWCGAQVTKKEKFEGELKKELKRLQRVRDQIRSWLSTSEAKAHLEELEAARRQIEVEMERFKQCEKASKIKAFSKEGLVQQPRKDPSEKAKVEAAAFLKKSMDSLQVQIDEYEAEIETISGGKTGKKLNAKVLELEGHVTKHGWHKTKLDQVLRLLENEEISPEDVDALKESISWYLDMHQDEDYMADDALYDDMPFHKLFGKLADDSAAFSTSSRTPTASMSPHTTASSSPFSSTHDSPPKELGSPQIGKLKARLPSTLSSPRKDPRLDTSPLSPSPLSPSPSSSLLASSPLKPFSPLPTVFEPATTAAAATGSPLSRVSAAPERHLSASFRPQHRKGLDQAGGAEGEAKGKGRAEGEVGGERERREGGVAGRGGGKGGGGGGGKGAGGEAGWDEKGAAQSSTLSIQLGDEEGAEGGVKHKGGAQTKEPSIAKAVQADKPAVLLEEGEGKEASTSARDAGRRKAGRAGAESSAVQEKTSSSAGSVLGKVGSTGGGSSLVGKGAEKAPASAGGEREERREKEAGGAAGRVDMGGSIAGGGAEGGAEGSGSSAHARTQDASALPSELLLSRPASAGPSSPVAAEGKQSSLLMRRAASAITVDLPSLPDNLDALASQPPPPLMESGGTGLAAHLPTTPPVLPPPVAAPGGTLPLQGGPGARWGAGAGGAGFPGTLDGRQQGAGAAGGAGGTGGAGGAGGAGGIGGAGGAGGAGGIGGAGGAGAAGGIGGAGGAGGGGAGQHGVPMLGSGLAPPVLQGRMAGEMSQNDAQAGAWQRAPADMPGALQQMPPNLSRVLMQKLQHQHLMQQHAAMPLLAQQQQQVQQAQQVQQVQQQQQALLRQLPGHPGAQGGVLPSLQQSLLAQQAQQMALASHKLQQQQQQQQQQERAQAQQMFQSSQLVQPQLPCVLESHFCAVLCVPHFYPWVLAAAWGVERRREEERSALQCGFQHMRDHGMDDRVLRTSAPSAVVRPGRPCEVPAMWPHKPIAPEHARALFERLGMDALFFAFYFQQSTYMQYLAARELKKQSWRFHKGYNTWFQRHVTPPVITEEYERGGYVYFDFHLHAPHPSDAQPAASTGWCQRVKDDFMFEYQHLEDELDA
ncbi:unnamed protein product [Closterium sp. Yama58-4]|nr:unnamed protein product [Closterium sp. Yama58-4]